MPSYRPFKNKLWYIPYFGWEVLRFMGKLWSDKTIEIVHIHGAAEGSFYRKYILFLLAKRVFKRKVIYHIHSGSFLDFYLSRPTFVQRWMRQAVEGSDVLICLSQKWHRLYTRRFPKANVKVLANVVAPPDRRIPRQRCSGEPLKLLFLGLIGERKGVFDLLDVFDEHKDEWAGKVQLILGGNGETDRLQQTIKEFGLEQMVTFAGWVSGEKKETLLNEADVFVLPSYNEALPLSILEAMSYHMPILSTRIGGIPEMVTDRVNGFLVEPGDRDMLYERIQEFIATPALVEVMGHESGKRIQEYYPETVFEQLSAIYTTLLSTAASVQFAVATK